MRIQGYDMYPLTPERFGDFETVLGRGGIGGCWCMYWLTDRMEAFNRGTIGGSKGANKAAFREVIAAGPPGLLAYDGDEPVGWVRVMPRARHPGLARSRLYGVTEDIGGIWSVSCFVIRRAWRGRSLSAVLLRAAIAHARAGGARAVEAYPNDAEGRLSGMALYRGRASTFRRFGFEEVWRTGKDKPLMRLTLG
ncbi:MAG: GNAT family N-acetyltransferase [Rhodobacter sp.]|nr:GNAT family N-acetyltransferase [Rhodobacter sp.]